MRPLFFFASGGAREQEARRNEDAPHARKDLKTVKFLV
jgi:hypothetical protein